MSSGLKGQKKPYTPPTECFGGDNSLVKKHAGGEKGFKCAQ
jgi:hypothetical protein